MVEAALDRRPGSEDADEAATFAIRADGSAAPQELEKIAWTREFKDYTEILANVAFSAGVLLAAGL